MEAPATLDDLVAIEAIKQLKGKYFLYLDTKHWEAWRQLFTDDLRTEGTFFPDASRDVFVNGVRDSLVDAVTAHHGHTPLIEITGADTARGVWAMYDDVRFPVGHSWAGAHPRRIGYGHYEEEYRRVNGEWKISFMRLARLHVWSEPIAGVEVNAKTLSSSEQWL